MREHEDPTPERLTPELAELRGVLQGRTEKLETKHGVTASLVVFDHQDREVIWHRPDESYFAASLAKLYIAAALRASVDVSPDTSVRLEVFRAIGGSGEFDKGWHDEATVASLYEDMLVRSGNTAAIALVKKVLGEREPVNEFVRDEVGLMHTQLDQLGRDGFDFGHTTASDQAKLLRYLNQLDEESSFQHPLALLAQSSSDFGMRKHLADDVAMLVKEGRYDNTDEDGLVRHNAGYVATTAAGSQRLLVVAMSRAPRAKLVKPAKAWAAEHWLEQVGADLESYLKGRPYQTREMLGRSAIFGFHLER